MLRIGLISFVFVLQVLNSFAQNEQQILKPSSFNILEVQLDWQDNAWETHISIRNPGSQWECTVSTQELNGDFHLIDSLTKKPISAEVWETTERINISFNSAKHPFLSPQKKIHLDSFQVIQSIAAPNVHQLSIDLSNYYGKVSVSLADWAYYTDWKEKRTLQAFVLKCEGVRPEFNIEDLYGFPIYRLVVPCLLNDELFNFPDLEQLSSYGVYTNFTQQLSRLEKLILIEEYGNRYDNAFETLHAERYFRSLLELSSPDSTFHMTSLGTLISLSNSSPDHFPKRADLMVYENDLTEYSGKTPENDTLLQGKIRCRKPKGLWTFKLKDQYPRNDREKHYINFKDLPSLEYPQNEFWSLKYANDHPAIEGEFKDGMKQGVWKYYHENGTLRSTRTFRNDTLIRNKILFDLHGNFLESRLFYKSEDEVYQSIQYGNDSIVRLNIIRYDGLGMPYHFDFNGAIHYRKEGEHQSQVYFPTSPNYQKVIREGIIDKLYPEYIGQQLPFTIGK